MLRAAAFHIPPVSVFIRLFTSGAEYRAVGGSKRKVMGVSRGCMALEFRHFSKFDPISVNLRPPVFTGPSILLSSL